MQVLVGVAVERDDVLRSRGRRGRRSRGRACYWRLRTAVVVEQHVVHEDRALGRRDHHLREVGRALEPGEVLHRDGDADGVAMLWNSLASFDSGLQDVGVPCNAGVIEVSNWFSMRMRFYMYKQGVRILRYRIVKGYLYILDYW